MTARAREALALFAVFCFLYLYFFQGGGWNQNSRLDTIRAVVEQGTFEIGALAGNTGDVAILGDRIYSNKPPGQALLAVPLYFVLYHAERMIGIEPGSPAPMNFNAWLLTFATSGLPAAGLVWLLLLFFRRRGATPSEGLLLAAGFGTGTLLLPYAGVMMGHLPAAFLLFGGFYLLSAEECDDRGALLGGAAIGLAVLVDFLAAPAAFALLAYGLGRRLTVSRLASLLAGPLVFALVLAAHNQACFGHPLVSSYSAEPSYFRTNGLLAGVLDWPRPIRLYWLTVHPFRGIFYCCPLLLLPLLSIASPRRWRDVRPESWLAIGIAGTFMAFNMSFNGWTGGWGVGPRYLIPATPFVYALALTGLRRLPRLSVGLVALSTAFMFAVTAVGTMVPSPSSGAPPSSDPVRSSVVRLAAGRVSISRQSVLEYAPARSDIDRWDSFNLGEIAGLEGWMSLVPAALLLVALCARLSWPFVVRSPARR